MEPLATETIKSPKCFIEAKTLPVEYAWRTASKSEDYLHT
jgi:hypothetical protein